jgi:hypothetical protein
MKSITWTKGRVVLATFLLLMGVLWVANRVRIYYRAQQVIPAVIEISGIQEFGMSPGQINCMVMALLVRCESSGAVVLNLSDCTVDAISKNGLAFFDNATVARGALSHRGPAAYESWQFSPLPEEWFRTETLSGLWHGAARAGINASMRKRLAAAGQQGVFYTRKIGGDATLVVIPSERLVVYTWSD